MSIANLPWNQPEAAERTCVRDEAGELTYAEVSRGVDAVAEQFAEYGVGRGDVVAHHAAQPPRAARRHRAAWRLGAAATPVNPVFTATEARYQLRRLRCAPSSTTDRRTRRSDGRRSGWRLAIGDASSRPAARARRRRRTTWPCWSTRAGRPAGPRASCSATPTSTRWSGSMAEAHGAVTAADHCLLILPLFHVNAVMVSLLAPLRVGGRLTIVGRFSPQTFFDEVERIRPTYFSAVPTIYALLASLPADVKPDTSSLRFVVCGAAPVSQELLTACERRFGFTMVEGYGLTEGTCASACNPVGPEATRKLGHRRTGRCPDSGSRSAAPTASTCRPARSARC